MNHSAKLMFFTLALMVSFGAIAGSGDREDRRARLLEQFDTDGDGQLSESERSAAREAGRGRGGEDFEARRAEILGEFDLDGDGRLGESERRALRESGMMRRGGRGGADGGRRGGRGGADGGRRGRRGGSGGGKRGG